jgi:hypothetical protein
MPVRTGDSSRDLAPAPAPALGLVFGCLLAAVAAGCGPARSPVQPTVSLRMAGTPASATVIIDEEALGTLDFVAARGVALPLGVHHVTVKAPGYFPSDQTVEAKEGSGPVRLAVALVAVPE